MLIHHGCPCQDGLDRWRDLLLQRWPYVVIYMYEVQTIVTLPSNDLAFLDATKLGGALTALRRALR